MSFSKELNEIQKYINNSKGKGTKYAFYLKENLKLITFLLILNDPDNAEYEKPIYDYITVSDEDFIKFKEELNRKEIIVKNGKLQEMVYTAEVVKYNDDTYAKLDNYDFRLEGVEYTKIAEDDAGYLAFKVAEELKEAKKLKIEECRNTFNSIKMVIKDIETKQILDEGVNFKAEVFDELIEFNEFPARYFSTISFVSNERIYTDYIPLSKDSLRILYNRTKDYTQYKKTNLFDNESKIYKLNTINEINNYTFKAGVNMNNEVASTFEILVKKEIDIFNVREVHLKNFSNKIIKTIND